MLVPHNTAHPIACTYRTPCYTIIGISKVLIILLVILAMAGGYLLIIQQQEYNNFGQDSGQDPGAPIQVESYYPGFLGLYRKAQLQPSGRDLDIPDGM